MGEIFDMMSRRSTALASVILVMIVWGSTFVITKAAVSEIPPLTLSALRFLIAAIVLVPIAAARGGLRCLPRPLPIASLLLAGLTGIALFHVGFNYALVYGSASQGALIFALVPAAVAVATVICLKETLSLRRAVGIALSVCGVALVAVTGGTDGASPHPLLGALCMLAAVAAWAIYTVIAKRLADADPIVFIASVSVIGMVLQLPTAALELMQTPWSTPSPRAWFGALFLGVVASALAFVVYSWALRHVDANLVGVFINLDPVVGVLMAVVVLGETLGIGQAVGGGVALAGMWLASTDVGRSA
jgi:drug/metabolite transporter (DMT)-like permease